MSGATGKAQCTEEDLKTMSPEEIVEAEDDGRLDTLLGRRTDTPPIDAQ